MDCPHCGCINTVKWGHSIYNGKKNQRYRCKRCGKYFLQTTSPRAAFEILVPRPMAANLFFELKTFLETNPNVRLRRGDVSIREIAVRAFARP